MKIYLNEQLLDVTLENEKNLLDVYKQLEKLIKKEDKYILSFLVDDKNLEVSDLENQLISDIEQFSLVVGKEIDLLAKSLDELGNYLERIHDNLKEKEKVNQKEKESLLDGFNWILEVLEYTQKKLNIQIDSFYIISYEKNLKFLIEEIKEQIEESNHSIQGFCENILNLKLFQEDLIYRVSLIDLSLEELSEVILSFCKFIPAFKTELEKVNENLQTGKDNIAVSLFNHSVIRLNVILTTLISIEQNFSYLNIDKIVINNVSFKSFFKQINETLNSIADAFEQQDIIEAGDLIEYELSENIETFGKYLIEIEKKLKAEVKKS